ncbi:MAG: polymerase beta domain protein region [Pseudobdellovibrio sp.]|jgi:hypothetical protein|nr:polymerase beta domain protein region [Pseudobdellovibrio sp.]
MLLTGSQITQVLVEEIKSWSYSMACWEGGSAANKRNDQYSDVDLVLAVTAGKTEEALTKIEDLLNSKYKVTHKWRVPSPTWHGHGQCFYKLAGTPLFFFLDIVVMEEGAKQKFLETERHGHAVVYFDKNNFIKPETADTADFWKKQKDRLQTIEASFPFFKELVLKEAARKRPIDTMAFYRTMTNFLVELLGMKYRPYRYDFGLRYTHIDFPQDVQKMLEEMLYVNSVKEIESQVLKIEMKVNDLISELKK